ncbi:MAG: hypothetical protein LBU76_01755 [Azoarcus sp.]|jgi:hypothetical protein|nr:hypothetical protein [Azoarcus sp.]
MEGQANIIVDYAMFDFFSSKEKFKKSSYRLHELQAVLKDFLNDSSSKENLPKGSKSKCETEPSSADIEAVSHGTKKNDIFRTQKERDLFRKATCPR